MLSDAARETFQATIPEFLRNWLDFSERPIFYNELTIKRLTLQVAAVNPPRGSPRRPQTRAPPFPLYRQPV